jgi:type I restriction enzyme S subunit
MKWPKVAIKECGRVMGGATPKSSIPDYWDGDVAWVTPKDIADLPGKYIGDTPRKITEAGLAKCAAQLLPPNSVFLSSRAPIGHVAINTVPMATNQGFKSIVPGPKLDSGFLYWWLRSNTAQIQSLGNGATFKEISKAVVERIEIPLPPLDEQKRIAAILDKADALRRLRQQAIDRLNTLSQSIFHEMFGSDYEHQVRMGELLTELRYGTSNKSSADGIPTLRIPNVVGGTIDYSDLKTVAVSEKELARLTLEDGDILFVRTNGNPDYVGRAAVFASAEAAAHWHADTPWIFASYLIRGKPNRRLVNPVFLQAYLATREGRAALRAKCKTSAGQFNINTKGLSSIQIPTQSLIRQNEFADRIQALQSKLQTFRVHQLRLVDLFASLQQRAFAGEL